MSIQPNRVVWRIVDEVLRGPRSPLAVERWPSVPEFGDQQVQAVRCAARSAAGGRPFATLFHFWTHALMAFLELHGQGDQLEGAAGYAMCQRLAVGAIERELEGYRSGLESPRAISPSGRPLDAYRMMDGPCRRSLVVETDVEWLALFRSHGPRVPVARIA